MALSLATGRKRSISRSGIVGASILALTMTARTTIADEPAADAPASAALASADASSGSSAGTGALDEVTVTARRRTERAQDVPISMTVLQGKQLQDVATTNPLDQVQFEAPSLGVLLLNPRNAQLSVRGIGNNPANDGLSRSVGIYVDGVYLDSAGMASTNLQDVDQVEVLRGPQGTLFGKNTTGGALNITTNAPTFSPQIGAGLTAGSYDTLGAEGVISGPIVDSVLAGRLSAYHDSHSGYISSPNGGPYDDLGSQGGRLQFLYQPTADLSVRYIGDFSQERDHSGFQLLYSTGAPNATIPFSRWSTSPGISALVDPGNPWSTNANEPQITNSYNWGNELLANWTPEGGYTLTNVAAVRYFDFSPVNNSGLTVYAPAADAPLYSSNANVRDRQASEELRLASPVGGPVDFVAGLYYFWKNLDGLQRNAYGNLYSVVTGSKNAPYDNAMLSYDSLFSTSSGAAFAQANWHLTDRLTFTAGVRETYETDRERFIRFGLTGGTGTPPASTIPYDGSGSIEDWSTGGLASLAYKLSDQVLGYATVSHGAKAGGFIGATTPTQTGSTFAPFSTLELRPESANDAEIGLKSSWLSHRLVLNADAFYTRIHDYQIAATVTSPAGITAAGTNVDAVYSKGFELELTGQPLQGLSITAAGAFDRATYGAFPNAPPVQGSTAAFQNLSGRPVNNAPRWTANAQIAYSRALSSSLLGYVAADYAYKSGQYGYIDDSPYSWIRAYGLAGFRLGVDAADHYDVSLWIRNAFNTANFEIVGPLPSGLGGYYANVGEPRVFGATVRVSF